MFSAMHKIRITYRRMFAIVLTIGVLVWKFNVIILTGDHGIITPPTTWLCSHMERRLRQVTGNVDLRHDFVV